MKNADNPAMPQSVAIDTTGDIIPSGYLEGAGGLTKREYAAIEMAKTLEPPRFCVGHEVTQLNLNKWADKAAMMADALLDRLEKIK